jgi:hypothetical protein
MDTQQQTHWRLHLVQDLPKDALSASVVVDRVSAVVMTICGIFADSKSQASLQSMVLLRILTTLEFATTSSRMGKASM